MVGRWHSCALWIPRHPEYPPPGQPPSPAAQLAHSVQQRRLAESPLGRGSGTCSQWPAVLEPLAGLPSVQPELGDLARPGGGQGGLGKYPLRNSMALGTGAATICAGHAFPDELAALRLWAKYLGSRVGVALSLMASSQSQAQCGGTKTGPTLLALG